MKILGASPHFRLHDMWSSITARPLQTHNAPVYERGTKSINPRQSYCDFNI